MENNFSKRLTQLMKQRKISGQKIGEAVGKSQKTISRYANGEIDPPVEMKNKIYKAISDIGGYAVDARTQEECDLLIELQNMPWTTTEIELGNEIQMENERRQARLISYFKSFTAGAKKYFINNCEIFYEIQDWEDWILDIYKELPSDKQEYVINELEQCELTMETLEYNTKIAGYCKMISESKNRPFVVVDKDIDITNLSKRDEVLLEKFFDRTFEYDCKKNNEILSEMTEGPLIEPKYLKYTKEDWYFLFRVQVFEMYDDEQVMWDSDNGILLGPKLGELFDSVMK